MRSARVGLALALVASLALPYAAFSEPAPGSVDSDGDGLPDAADAGTDAGSVSVNDVLHFATPAHIITGSGHSYPIAPGYYVPAAKWSALDLELHRLQEVEIRINAENKSLKTANESRPWGLVKLAAYSIGVGIVVGVVGFWYVRR